MAGKFVDLNEAAKMIGVTAESLVEMRSKGAIFGYRDGASWKFKVDEVERVIRERGVEARDSDSGILNANDDEFENLISGLSSKILADKAQEESGPGAVLISEQELGVSATGQSTIIGKGKEAEQRPSDSDLRLADDSSKDILGPSDSNKDILGGGSDKLIEAPSNKLDLASASDVLHGSDIHVAAGSGTGEMPALQKPGSSGGLHLDDDLSLGEDNDIGSSDSALDEEIRPKSGSKTGSSGKGSDVTLGAGDSGINLSPSDSGLSLEEEPLDLGGGSGVESLELPEDEDVIAMETEAADQDQPTQLKADNEFLLSAGDTLEEDESDSGSQVIALEDSESFDQDAATMLKTEGGLGADVFQPLGAEGALEGAAPGMGAAQPVYVQVASVEAPYSVWNVLSLGVVAGMLALSGMMMVDVMLNMWAFGGTSSVSTGIMDVFVSMFGM
jgi:hypothetical protein